MNKTEKSELMHVAFSLVLCNGLEKNGNNTATQKCNPEIKLYKIQ